MTISRPFRQSFALLLFILCSTQSVLATEHIVIIDNSLRSPPAIVDVLYRVGLDSSHQNVSCIWNNSAFSGFAATLKRQHVTHLRSMADILIVEKSIKVAHTGLIRREEARPNATWGLERISNPFFHPSNTDTMDYTYNFDGGAPGNGADVYILDSGIWVEHHGFTGRAEMIYSFDGNDTDTNGHGTHVAGTAGAIDFGVASNANIFGVRVIDGDGGGSTATVIAGIDYVVTQHDLRKQNSSFVGSVMSLSLAALGKVSALDQAISAAVQAGIHTCVAAGNDDVDACTGSPAASGGSNGTAITVGSIGIDGQHSTFSNYGSCVDVYAPGEDVLSAGLHNPDLLVFLSGTSQATPHVTGMVAYAMSNATLANDPALMKEWVLSTALPIGDGTFMASNGADSVQDGMLGFSKTVYSDPNSDSDFIAR